MILPVSLIVLFGSFAAWMVLNLRVPEQTAFIKIVKSPEKKEKIFSVV